MCFGALLYFNKSCTFMINNTFSYKCRTVWTKLGGTTTKNKLINSPEGLDNRVDVDTNTQLFCFMDSNCDSLFKNKTKTKTASANSGKMTYIFVLSQCNCPALLLIFFFNLIKMKQGKLMYLCNMLMVLDSKISYGQDEIIPLILYPVPLGDCSSLKWVFTCPIKCPVLIILIILDCINYYLFTILDCMGLQLWVQQNIFMKLEFYKLRVGYACVQKSCQAISVFCTHSGSKGIYFKIKFYRLIKFQKAFYYALWQVVVYGCLGMHVTA